jgi:ribosomal protein S18 acetylase RimI-like enzyme
MDRPGPSAPFVIRSFRGPDLPACTQLYRDGLLGGKIAENDTGLDIDDIEQAYMSSPGSHFWVAELPPAGGAVASVGIPGKGKESAEGAAAASAACGEIIGMIGVQHHEDDVGEIRRLRVRNDWRRRGVGSALFETALKFCQEHGYLKITLDTFMEREPAIKLFEKFHFRHHRTRNIGGKDILHFYLDLYQRDERPKKREAAG